jgi:hypothetical protein
MFWFKNNNVIFAFQDSTFKTHEYLKHTNRLPFRKHIVDKST